MVAKLCSILGMSDQEFRGKTIFISPKISSQTTVFGSYDSKTQTVTVYPGLLWEGYQDLVFRTQLATTGRGIKRQVILLAPEVVVHQETEKNIREGQRQKIAKQVYEGLLPIVGETHVAHFMEAVGEGDLGTVNRFLKPSVEKNLRRDLAHELKHAKDNPDESRVNLYRKLLPKLAVLSYTALQVLFVRSMGLLDGSITGTLIPALWVGGQSLLMYRVFQIFGYWFNPWELQARSFAEKVLAEPQYTSLMTIKGQWRF